MMATEDIPIGQQFQQVLEILDELGEAGDRLTRAIEEAKSSLNKREDTDDHD